MVEREIIGLRKLKTDGPLFRNDFSNTLKFRKNIKVSDWSV